MSDKASYQQRVESQFNQLVSQIEQLRNKATTQPAISTELSKLDAKRNTVQGQINSLRNAGESSWRGLQGGINTALSDLNSNVQNTKNRFG